MPGVYDIFNRDLSNGIRAVGTREGIETRNRVGKVMGEILQGQVEILKMMNQLLEKVELATGSRKDEVRIS